jgi:hypothetical protein
MKEEDLKKFIEFTKTLLTQMQGNSYYSWFFESFYLEIVNSFFHNSNHTREIDKFQSISESDVSRIKAYLSFIDKKALNYGRVYYKNISDDSLRAELIKDFKEMKIALKNDDIIEFGRRLSLQLENIFNFSLTSLNVYQLILDNPQHYCSVTPNWDNSNGKPFNFYKSFFSKETNNPVELSKVSFKTKSIFLSIHFNYNVNPGNMNDIYFLRNKGSHRSQLSQEEQNTLDRIILEFDKNYSFYIKVLFVVVNGIPNIR